MTKYSIRLVVDVLTSEERNYGPGELDQKKPHLKAQLNSLTVECVFPHTAVYYPTFFGEKEGWERVAWSHVISSPWKWHLVH
jgi:hypothetical protein